jgi:porphobilinogen deaminase
MLEDERAAEIAAENAAKTLAPTIGYGHANTLAARRALDEATARAVGIERLFLARLGEGCHTAFACHVTGQQVHLFREDFGRQSHPMPARDVREAEPLVERILAGLT